jgi:hypothetical protein
LQKAGGFLPPTFLKGLQGPRGHPDPKKERSPILKVLEQNSQAKVQPRNLRQTQGKPKANPNRLGNPPVEPKRPDDVHLVASTLPLRGALRMDSQDTRGGFGKGLGKFGPEDFFKPYVISGTPEISFI